MAKKETFGLFSFPFTDADFGIFPTPTIEETENHDNDVNNDDDESVPCPYKFIKRLIESKQIFFVHCLVLMGHFDFRAGIWCVVIRVYKCSTKRRKTRPLIIPLIFLYYIL